MRVTCYLILFLLIVDVAYAQQPFQEYGYKVKVATLSGGKYEEFFDQDTLVEIGSVVLNVNSGEIIGFVAFDTVYSEATLEPEIISRWISPDPLSEKYYSYSPYHFSGNNPIRFVDPTGMFFIDYHDQDGNKIGTDGNDDGRVVVVTDRKEVKSIKETDKAGGVTAFASVNSGVELPSAFVRGEMGKAVERAGQPTGDDKTGGFHEEGGIFGKDPNGNESVIHAVPGAAANPGKDDYAQVDVFSGETAQNSLNVIEGTFHTHPSGTNGNASFDQNPSNFIENGERKGDIPSAKSWSSPGSAYNVTGNSYVLGTGDNRVRVYNQNGVIATFPLKKFTTLGVKK